MIRGIRFPFFLYFWYFFGYFLVFFCFFLWYSLFFNNNIDTRNNKYKYRHKRMDFNHTSSHFTYAYDMNIYVWVWHEWEVWFELWCESIIVLSPNFTNTNECKRCSPKFPTQIYCPSRMLWYLKILPTRSHIVTHVIFDDLSHTITNRYACCGIW